MTEQKLFLKQNVFMEPLVNHWYAWGNLIPTHTYAMTMLNLHSKTMESYIQSPEMHERAVNNPKMLGGPFINLPGDQSGLIKDLLKRTLEAEADLVAFARAVKALDEILRTEALGASLQEIYERVPPELQGFVELGYDLNSHPSIRFIERMLYRSPLHRDSRQSIRLSINQEDYRSFLLTSPLFADDTHLHYHIPYASESLDRLFRMKWESAPLANIAEFMPEDAAQQSFFHSLFTTEAPAFRHEGKAALGTQVRVRYFGHAVLCIESKDVTILTDPVVSYSTPNTIVPRFTYEDLPEVIDYVLITHNHQDHILWETLIPLRHRIQHIVVPKCSGGSLQDPSIKLMLEATGFKSIIELDEMEELPIPGGFITGIPFFGEHGDLHIRSKLAYHFRINGRTLMAAADSNNLMPEVYTYVRKFFGPVKAAFVGMECAGAPLSWLYGPLLTQPLGRKQDQSRRLDASNFEKAYHMLKSLESEEVYVYAMGQEPWLKFVSSITYTDESTPIVESNKLIERLKSEGRSAERLFAKKEIYL